MITAIIPAHNEQASLANTIFSLRSQTVQPDRILVASDNSTDDTVAVAIQAGAEVFETIDNTYRKAGALNQALARVDTDLVLCIDADTNLVPNFIELALKQLDDPNVGAVGGVFSGRNPQSSLDYMQSNEYGRYKTEIKASGRVSVLSGTAALIRVDSLRAVSEARGSLLPGYAGDIYDRDALTEDSELTIALKTLDYKLVSPVECGCDTELMPTYKDLVKQRVRWYRGALENLLAHRFNKTTQRYWRQQISLGLSTIIYIIYLLSTIYLVLFGQMHFSVFWAAIGLVFWIERQVTLTKPGIKGRILSMLMIPEILYALILQYAFVRALWNVVTKQKSEWSHLQEEKLCITLTEAS